MTEQEKLFEQLHMHEGIKTKLYKDTAVPPRWTIGVGRNLSDVGLSQDEIDYLLNNDVKNVVSQLDRNFPWWSNLSDVRQRVMIDMCFNMGIKTLMTFKNTLKAIKDSNWQAAGMNMRTSLWAKEVGARATRLALMMETGSDYRTWPS